MGHTVQSQGLPSLSCWGSAPPYRWPWGFLSRVESRLEPPSSCQLMSRRLLLISPTAQGLPTLSLLPGTVHSCRAAPCLPILFHFFPASL